MKEVFATDGKSDMVVRPVGAVMLGDSPQVDECLGGYTERLQTADLGARLGSFTFEFPIQELTLVDGSGRTYSGYDFSLS